ncbi:MAG TPA: hypothetical protein DCP98_06215 [Sphaerochaeta sp.]|nr:hypothetical protein [Sphaerochaeta sp.]
MRTGNQRTRKTTKAIILLTIAALVTLLGVGCSDVIANITGNNSSSGASVSGTVFFTEDVYNVKLIINDKDTTNGFKVLSIANGDVIHLGIVNNQLPT